jgi:HEAT repeat protein
MEVGIDHKGHEWYKPDVKKRWQSWYEENGDYLYSPEKRRKTAYSWASDRILVDMEAKLQGIPTETYRKMHLWASFDEIKEWRDAPEYEKKLKDFCFSMLLNLLWSHGYYGRAAMEALTRIDDPRGIQILKKLSEMIPLDQYSTSVIIWTLGGTGDPSCIPYLERFAKCDYEDVAERAKSAQAYLQLLKKHGKQVQGKPEKRLLMRCLEGPEGVGELVKMLEGPSRSLISALEAAGFVKDEKVRAAVRALMEKDDEAFKDVTICFGFDYAKSPAEISRIRAAVALVRQGDKSRLDYIRGKLKDVMPGVQLAAAEALWQLGSREGSKTVLDILDLGPLETGGEGVTVEESGFSVKAVRGSNVEKIRKACELLGDMGDKSAIGKLKKVLHLNINGILRTGGSGTGWGGRPDAVALAKLGDFSGIPLLVDAIKNGDRLGVTRDFEKIGLKRFARELIPMLDHREEDKRVHAAVVIFNLLTRGK